MLGRSELGAPVRAYRVGEPTAYRRVLVVGCIHGTECAGVRIVHALQRTAPHADLWLVPNLNPDGYRLGLRQNGRGVDLNRNFGAGWRARGARWGPQYSGPRPWSERETRLARRLIARIQPDVTLWYHQPQGLVRAWGASVPEARRFAELAGERFRALRWPRGTASNWQNHRFPGTASFVVELPPGPLSGARLRRHARAIVRLAERPEPVRWRRSLALGRPEAGQLVGGVQLPPEGGRYFTWDPLLHRSPDRAWRRWGTDRLVRTVLRVLADFRRTHPRAARVGIGDLSRPHGGPFGPRHVSHQNGLDVDVYYPRRDRLERPPDRPVQINRALAQDLVDRFVRAGAVRLFVGPHTRLRGDPRVVQPLAHHDTHVHVRLPPG
ncbi:MAG TPA: penicillin-insensitive murein endopeptidase [Gaiellaceae bacterium]|nr:penicillin-insensitive murein endopeptidase [Gaiellaceae bacterium]